MTDMRHRSAGKHGQVTLLFLSILTTALGAGRATEASVYRRLAEYYAPVIYQETHSEVLDYLTRFDFDGDWNGANNWQNAYLFDLPAAIYYSVIESQRHYFITYAFFHPRDYTAQPLEGFAPKTEHENDMEGCTLLVEKDETEWGRPILLETLAHDRFYKYDNRDAGRVRPGRALLDGPIVFLEEGSEGHHRAPAVFIEAEGHGVRAAGEEVRDVTFYHPGVIYRFTGHAAEVPAHNRAGDVSYELISIEDTLWARRFEVGSESAYCCAGRFRLIDGSDTLIGESFNGPIGGCAARPPWGWDERNDGPIAKGDWFRDPLFSFRQQLQISGLSGNYLHNPFFMTQVAEGAESLPLCSSGGAGTTVSQATTETLAGVAQVLLSGGFSRERVRDKARQLFLSNSVLLEWSGRAGLEVWEWDKTAAAELSPSVVNDHYSELLRIPLARDTAFSSPVFRAPARYFNRVILKYKCSGDGALARVHWSHEDGDTTAPDLSMDLKLNRSDSWTIGHIDLGSSPLWDRSITVSRVRLEIIPPPVAGAAAGGIEAAPSVNRGQVMIKYIVFDRAAFADTFAR